MGGLVEPVIIGNATLYCGDCLELLRDDGWWLLSGVWSVDVAITDPPYSEYTHQNAKGNRSSRGVVKVGGAKLALFNHLSGEVFDSFLDSLMCRVKRWTILTCDHRFAAKSMERDDFVRLGAWVKPNPAPQISGDRPSQGHESVLILHGEGKKTWNGGGKSAVWRFPCMTNGQETPTQKPIALAESFVSLFTNPNETILDPFMGSGTTGVACMNLGRKFVGIEIEPKYFDIACERIDQAQRQQRLFA